MNEGKPQYTPAEKAAFKARVVETSQEHLTGIPHMKALGIEMVDFGRNAVTVKLPYKADLGGNPDIGGPGCSR